MTIGPVEICIVGFKETGFGGDVLEELTRLSNNDALRVIDVLGVVKTAEGDLRAIKGTDAQGVQTAAEIGPVIGALLGIQEERSTTNGAGGDSVGGDEQPGFAGAQVFNLADELRTGEAAVIAVIEHRWMARMEDAVARLDAAFLLDTFVDSDDLIRLGSQVARALEEGKRVV